MSRDEDLNRAADIYFINVHDMVNYTLIGSADFPIVIGHSEYWFRQVRSNLDRFVSSGEHILMASGNTIWWQVLYQDGNDEILVSYKSGNPISDPITDPKLKIVNWFRPMVGWDLES